MSINTAIVGIPDILFLLLSQAGLLKDAPSQQFLEQQAKEVLLKNLETLYACGGRILDNANFIKAK